MSHLENYFDEFLSYLKSEKNVSKLTITSYTNDFNLLLHYLLKNNLSTNPDELKTSDLRKYIAFLKIEKEFKTRTIRRKIHSLSSLFKFLIEQEYIAKNPMLPIHAPKEPETIPIYIIEEDLKKLLEAPMKHKSEHSLRDKVLLETLVYTGIRRSELISLNFDDINFKTNTITVRKGKGNKQRVLPILSPLDEHIWSYLQSRLPLENKAVFISPTGNRICASQVQKIFKKYLKLCGLDDKGYTIHKTRHAFATLLIKNGANVLTVQQLLGHADLNTTKIYTHLDTNHLQEEIKKFPLTLDYK